MKITNEKNKSTPVVYLVFLLLTLSTPLFASYTYILDDAFVVLEDTFEGDAGVVDSNLWTTWHDTSSTFSQVSGDAKVCVSGTYGAYYDAQYASKQRFNPYKQKTEFTFTQGLGGSLGAYASNRNYITTSNTNIGNGFGIYWERYPYGRVKLYEYKNGGATALLYDSGNAASYVSQYSFSLVLDGASYEFYWAADDTDGTTIADSNSKGTHSLSKDDIGDGLYLGFGLNTSGKSGDCCSFTHHAGVAQHPTPAIYGTWDVAFRDNFYGTSVPYNNDPNYDQGLVDSGWTFGGYSRSIKRIGDGRLGLDANRYTTATLTTNNSYSFSRPTEFFVENLDISPSGFYDMAQKVKLFDPNSNNSILIEFRKGGDPICRMNVYTIVNGVQETIIDNAYTGDYTPNISVILTDSTLDFYCNGYRINFNDPNYNYSYCHDFNDSVVASGFKLQLIGCGTSSASGATSYCNGVVISHMPQVDVNDANFTVSVTVGSPTGKELDPYAFAAAGLDFNYSKEQFKDIFTSDHNDHDSLYNEFINFAKNQVNYHTFRYPSGGYVNLFFFGVSASDWIPASALNGIDPNSWIEVEDFFQFLVDGDFRTYLQVNTINYWDENSNSIKPLYDANSVIDYNGLAITANSVKNLAQWVKDNHYQRYITAWEIGNEDFGAEPNTYAIVAAAIIEEINDVFPNAEIIVTNQLDVWDNQTGMNTWSEAVLSKLTDEGVRSLVDGIVHHNYNCAHSTVVSSTAYQEYAAYVYLCPDDANQSDGYVIYDNGIRLSHMGMLRKRLDDYGYTNTSIYITEFSQGGVNEPYRKAIAGGLGNLHYLLGLINADRVDGSAFYTLLHNSAHTETSGYDTWGYDSIEYEADPNISPRFTSTPLSEMYNLVWKFARGKVLSCSSSKTRVNAYATQDGDKLRVIVFNEYDKPESADDVLVNIWGAPFNGTIEQLCKDSQAGDMWNLTLTIPSHLTSVNDVNVYSFGDEAIDTLASTSVAYSGHDVHELLLSEETIDCNGSQLNYILMPHTVAMFEFNLIPDKASNPVPNNNDTDIDTKPLLSWTGDGASYQNFYFGTDSTLGSTEQMGSLDANIFDFNNIFNDDFTIGYDPIPDGGNWIEAGYSLPPYSYKGLLYIPMAANAPIWTPNGIRQNTSKCPGVDLANGTVTFGWQSTCAGFGYLDDEICLTTTGLSIRGSTNDKGITVYRDVSSLINSLTLYIRDANGTSASLGQYSTAAWTNWSFKLVATAGHIDLYGRSAMVDPLSLGANDLLISQNCSIGSLGQLFAGIHLQKRTTIQNSYYHCFDNIILKQALKSNTTYYWRVDMVSNSNTVTSDTWNFTTD